MKPRVVLLVQARLGSTRLPGKMLMPLGASGTVIGRVLRGVGTARTVDQVVLATSEDASDDALAAQARQQGVTCFRGSLEDVLGRMHGAAVSADAQVVVRVTGDCPCLTPDWVDHAVESFLSSGVDYQGYPETAPDGLDVEVFTMAAMERAFRDARLSSEREHVTPYLWKHPELFRQCTWQPPLPASARNLSVLRFSVDTAADLHFVSDLLASHAMDSIPALHGVLLDEYPSLLRHALRSTKNEGFHKSLRAQHPKHPSLMLGLAAVGQSYASNRAGPQASASDLMYAALAAGMDCWDTAPAYGTSEDLIGQFVQESGLSPKVFTKVTVTPEALLAGPEAVAALMEASARRSTTRMNLVPQGIQLHNATSAMLGTPWLMEALVALKTRGLCASVGVSVYGEALAAADAVPGLDVIQVEYNVARTRPVAQCGAGRTRESHARLVGRSIMLRGLLAVEDELPSLPAALRPAAPKLEQLVLLARQACLPVRELALRYAASRGHLDALLVGAVHPVEISQNVQSWKRGPLDDELLLAVERLQLEDEWGILDPRRW